MKIVYFYDKKATHRFVALGQISTIIQSCYFKGIELNADKIIIEWHNMVTYPNWTDDGKFEGLLSCPRENTILPLIIVPKGTKITSRAKHIDLSEPNSLFDGCNPVISNPMKQQPTFEYLNKYYIDTGRRPIFKIKSDSDTGYILFHYRESPQKRQLERNTIYSEFEEIFYICRKLFKDMKLYKIGEPCKLDSEFDKVFGYFPDNIGELFRIINNSSMFVATTSGPLDIAYAFGVPSIVNIDNKTKNDYTKGKWNGKHGNTAYDWVDRNKYYFLWNNEYKFEDEIDRIIEFMKNGVEEERKKVNRIG